MSIALMIAKHHKAAAQSTALALVLPLTVLLLYDFLPAPQRTFCGDFSRAQRRCETRSCILLNNPFSEIRSLRSISLQRKYLAAWSGCQRSLRSRQPPKLKCAVFERGASCPTLAEQYHCIVLLCLAALRSRRLLLILIL